MRAFIIIIVALLFSSCAQAQDMPQNLFEGQWVNDRDSAVFFEVTEGLLSGHYQTALDPHARGGRREGR